MYLWVGPEQCEIFSILSWHHIKDQKKAGERASEQTVIVPCADSMCMRNDNVDGWRVQWIESEWMRDRARWAASLHVNCVMCSRQREYRHKIKQDAEEKKYDCIRDFAIRKAVDDGPKSNETHAESASYFMASYVGNLIQNIIFVETDRYRARTTALPTSYRIVSLLLHNIIQCHICGNILYFCSSYTQMDRHD